MGGSALPTISSDMYKRIAGDPRVSEIAKKYGFTIPQTMPTAPQAAAPQWTFPQYSQTWAFTPPTPSPMQLPPPFDPKTYGKSSSSGDRDGDGGSGGGRRRAADGILHRPGSYHGP